MAHSARLLYAHVTNNEKKIMQRLTLSYILDEDITIKVDLVYDVDRSGIRTHDCTVNLSSDSDTRDNGNIMRNKSQNSA